VNCGCTTTAAKKALSKPNPADSYSGFDAKHAEASKRKAEIPEPVKDTTEPEEAVRILCGQLQEQPAAAIQAEEQLKLWGSRQGVDKLVITGVRPLLKNAKVEVRAPAMRLTILLGGPDSNGDLIECLADSEYSIREAAFKALRMKTRRDFGFSPSGGEVARAQSVEEWRTWWETEQRKVAVQPPSVYETNPPSEPRVISKKEKSDDGQKDR
jgi:hypothetical protein